MNFVLSGATCYINKEFVKTDIAVRDGTIEKIGSAMPGYKVIDCEGMYIFPGFIDVHTHTREPGFEYKETMKTGTMSAAHGGYTDICSMPNLKPVPDTAENLKIQLDAIKKDAVIDVYPYASITKGQKGEELSDMEELSERAFAFSDDGRGVQSEEMMLAAMEAAKKCGKMIVAHCEDNSLLHGGYIHDGEYARKNGHKGICSESEWKPIERDLMLAQKTGCSYHVCHISAKESVQLIREAKKNGIDVTGETAPHYLVLEDLQLEDNGRFKMNPPIRSGADREALIEAIKDGTIDMIATDHAPHSMEEKSKGLSGSMMGVVGLETAFAVLYTELVRKGVITLEKLMQIMHDNAMVRFKIGSNIKEGEAAKLTVFDLNEEYIINPENFLSKGRSTPFEGRKVFGKCKMTICKGDIVWKENLTEN